MNDESLTWEELWQEWDSVSDNLENFTGLWNKKEEWNECSFHHIKHHGVPGGCPICMLKTFLEEKQSLTEQQGNSS